MKSEFPLMVKTAVTKWPIFEAYVPEPHWPTKPPSLFIASTGINIVPYPNLVSLSVGNNFTLEGSETSTPIKI